MAARRTRPDPNIDDPLSNDTFHDRFHAAYRAAGYNRAKFAEKLDINYHALDAIDQGKAMPKLPLLAAAAKLVGYTMDELYHGRQGRPAEGTSRAIPAVTAVTAVTASMKLAGVSGELLAVQLGHVTPAFVSAFAGAYSQAIDAGATQDAAFRVALVFADKARAFDDAMKLTAQGARPISPDALTEAAEQLRREPSVSQPRAAIARKRKHGRSRLKP